MADSTLIPIELAWSPAPRTVHSEALQVAAGTTLLQAVQDSALAQQPAVQAWLQTQDDSLVASIWGRTATPGQVLRAQDRIELSRPLQVDPKVARRERFAKQGAGAAGLFARRRAGAKPGY